MPLRSLTVRQFKYSSYQLRLSYESIMNGEEEVEKHYSPLSIAAFLIIGCLVSIGAGFLGGEQMHYLILDNMPFFFSHDLRPDLIFYPPIAVLLLDVLWSISSLSKSSELPGLLSSSSLEADTKPTRKSNRRI